VPALPVLLIFAACRHGGDSDEGSTDHGELLGVGVIPRDPTIALGDTVQLEANAFWADTTHDDITGDVDWIAVDGRVASVSGGLATGLAAGQSDIVATWTDGTSAKVLLTVLGEGTTIDDVRADPTSIELRVGDQVAIAVTASFSDGTTGDVAGTCSWSADDPVASVTSGVVEGVEVGTTTVRASCDGHDLSVPVEVVDEDATLPEPDLRITDVDGLPFDYGVEFTAMVENRGDGYAGAFWVDIALDASGTPGPGDPTDGYTWVPGLAGGSSTPVYIDVYDVATGAHTAHAIADSEDDVAESDEGNNTSSPITIDLAGAAAQANLRIVAFEGLSDGSYTYWTVEIENDGDDWSEACFVDLFPDEISDPQVGDDSSIYAYVPELAPGDSVTWEPETFDGPYYYGYWDSVVFVDSQGDVDESDETDNIEWATVYPY
jgi:hypothetical protein